MGISVQTLRPLITAAAQKGTGGRREGFLSEIVGGLAPSICRLVRFGTGECPDLPASFEIEDRYVCSRSWRENQLPVGCHCGVANAKLVLDP